MPLEIEIKLRIDNHPALRDALRRVNATRVASVTETNLFFDRPDRSLLSTNRGLRIRLERDTDTGSTSGLLTYKGPPTDSPLRPREAFDVAIDPPDQAIALVQALGFTQTLAYEKRREKWHLDHCEVVLDELPHLGTFMEIEGPSEAVVTAVQKKLNLDHLPPVRESYVHMIDDYIRTHHPETPEVRFSPES